MRYIAVFLVVILVGCRKESIDNTPRADYLITHEQVIKYYIDTVDTVFPVEQSFYVSSAGVLNANLHFVKYGEKKIFTTEVAKGLSSLEMGSYKSDIDRDSFYHYKGDTIANNSIYIASFEIIE